MDERNGLDFVYFYGWLKSIWEEVPDRIFEAEGVARRSDDKPNSDTAREVAVGRAIKSLYIKVLHHETLREIYVKGCELSKSPEANKGILKMLDDQTAMVNREYDNLVHGRVHVLMA